jgi:hypothetical protein
MLSSAFCNTQMSQHLDYDSYQREDDGQAAQLAATKM